MTQAARIKIHSDKQALAAVRSTLKSEYEAKPKGGWRAVGKAHGITGICAWRIVNDGFEPFDPKIREKLNLPVVWEVPACRECGQVHVYDHCTKRKEPPQWVKVGAEFLANRLSTNGHNHRPRRFTKGGKVVVEE